MNFIFGTLAEFQESPVMINIESISMIAGSSEGGCAVFFTEPQSRIALRESYEEIYMQIMRIKEANKEMDLDAFKDASKHSSSN